MRKNLLVLMSLAVFVFTLAFSLSATVQQAEAGPCENCMGICWCQGGQFWEGRWSNGSCNLNGCEDCFGPEIECW